MRTMLGALLVLGLLSACQAPMRPLTTTMPVNRNAALAAAYGMPEAPNAAAQRQFKKLDRNGDSFLSDAEYIAGQMDDYREADAADVQQFLGRQFAGFDLNKDRRLSLAEYIGPAKPATKAPATTTPVKAPVAKAPSAKPATTSNVTKR
jgi:hypothetical protein